MRNVIVVFGAGTRADGRLSVDLHRRLQTTLTEARRQPQAKIIVSGGAVTGPAEGPTMRRWLIASGISARRIVVEPNAKFTLDNAMKVAPLVAGLRATAVTLVTQQFHMKRAAALLDGALHIVSPQRITIREVAARNSKLGQNVHHLRVLEDAKLARDLDTLESLAQPPKMVRAHAWAGSIKMHRTNQ